jgi:uncharacterized membrane protein (UPF0127 family)
MIIYCNDIPVVKRVKIADTFAGRLIGLMGKKDLNGEEGLILMGCSSVHCFFMKIPIDAVYLSEGMNVLGMETIAPWHIGKRFKGAAHVLELKAGTSKLKFTVGDELILHEDAGKTDI